MIDLSIFINFYFTKYLFIASAFYGVCLLVRKLVMNK